MGRIILPTSWGDCEEPIQQFNYEQNTKSSSWHTDESQLKFHSCYTHNPSRNTNQVSSKGHSCENKKNMSNVHYLAIFYLMKIIPTQDKGHVSGLNYILRFLLFLLFIILCSTMIYNPFSKGLYMHHSNSTLTTGACFFPCWLSLLSKFSMESKNTVDSGIFLLSQAGVPALLYLLMHVGIHAAT